MAGIKRVNIERIGAVIGKNADQRPIGKGVARIEVGKPTNSGAADQHDFRDRRLWDDRAGHSRDLADFA